jgi:hypothetical protein
VTSAIATEVRRRENHRARSPWQRIGQICAAIALAGSALAWPSEHYRTRPVEFGREVLGVEPWSKQIEMLETVRDHKRVAIKAGHKVSKSHTIAWIALWFYSCFDDARVVMSSTTSRQVEQILWRELRMIRARAKHPIPGDMHELARSGLKAPDFREIVGFTAREAEAVAGISGKNLLYLIDEASGVPEEIFEAVEGNRAGGARIVLVSNPTQTEGEFYEAFHSKSAFYKTVSISSEDSPNVKQRREVVPGLATLEWIEEKRLEWGENSPLYRVRVKGEFVENETAKVLSIHDIGESEKRWHETKGIGRLHIGIDPAGPGLAGDETSFAARRGMRIEELLADRGLSEDAIVVRLLGFIEKHRVAGEEKPVLVVDREGPIGSALFYRLRDMAEGHGFELVGMKASDHAFRRPDLYDRVRDMLWGNLVSWVHDGGAMVEDTKLAKELHTPKWEQQLNGKLKVTPKKEIKKLIGRSPDRADAVTLSCWTPILDVDGKVSASPLAKPEGTARSFVEPEIVGRPSLDPYQALDVFNGRRPA